MFWSMASIQSSFFPLFQCSIFSLFKMIFKIFGSTFQKHSGQSNWVVGSFPPIHERKTTSFRTKKNQEMFQDFGTKRLYHHHYRLCHYHHHHYPHHHHHHHKNYSVIGSLRVFAFVLISLLFISLFSNVQSINHPTSPIIGTNSDRNDQMLNISSRLNLNGGYFSNSTIQPPPPPLSFINNGINSFVFDPQVTAKCERNLMHITVRFDQPFYGIVHVRNYRRQPCQIVGAGSLNTTLTIDLLAHVNRPNFCGVQRIKESEERSISLVVRLHRALELSDDKHFVITCGNTEFNNRNKNEKLMFRFVDRHGHKITKLYHGEPYRLRAEVVSSSQNDNQLIPSPIHSYQLYAKNCLIFNGNDSDVEFLDENGCPTLSTVTPFKQIGHNIAESDISSMFKLPGVNHIHLQCLFELIDNCKFCDSSLCHPFNSSNNETRRSKELSLVDMKMLASTSVYVFEPDQILSAPISTICTEWRFPWLIALCIMLGILLIIMMVVNIFLCTSMSCSCLKTEIVEHEPAIIEDYDPYKIDVGYYSPYDSRLSLNRTASITVAAPIDPLPPPSNDQNVHSSSNLSHHHLHHHNHNHHSQSQQMNSMLFGGSSSYSPTHNNNNKPSTIVSSSMNGHFTPLVTPSSHNNKKPRQRAPPQTTTDHYLTTSPITKFYNPYQQQSLKSEDFY